MIVWEGGIGHGGASAPGGSGCGSEDDGQQVGNKEGEGLSGLAVTRTYGLIDGLGLLHRLQPEDDG